MKQIADKLKEKNIAEYLIYMWQIEDLIRANSCDIDKMTDNVISSFNLNETEKESLIEWYDNLINMMRAEGVNEKGHLQINKNVILELEELHGNLLATTQFPFYHAAYYKALPFIVELRKKNSQKQESEIETCFEAMYGILLLRLQKKEITEETQKAIDAISNFLSMLANYYDKDSKNEIEW
jgi:hypothetical protein